MHKDIQIEQRRDLIRELIDNSTPIFSTLFKNLYERVARDVKYSEYLLRDFQLALKNIPQWSLQEVEEKMALFSPVKNEMKSYLSNIHILNRQLYPSEIQVEDNNELGVLGNFIKKTSLHIARELFKQPIIMHFIVKNGRIDAEKELHQIIERAIEATIRRQSNLKALRLALETNNAMEMKTPETTLPRETQLDQKETSDIPFSAADSMPLTRQPSQQPSQQPSDQISEHMTDPMSGTVSQKLSPYSSMGPSPSHSATHSSYHSSNHSSVPSGTQTPSQTGTPSVISMPDAPTKSIGGGDKSYVPIKKEESDSSSHSYDSRLYKHSDGYSSPHSSISSSSNSEHDRESNTSSSSSSISSRSSKSSNSSNSSKSSKSSRSSSSPSSPSSKSSSSSNSSPVSSYNHSGGGSHDSKGSRLTHSSLDSHEAQKELERKLKDIKRLVKQQKKGASYSSHSEDKARKHERKKNKEKRDKIKEKIRRFQEKFFNPRKKL